MKTQSLDEKENGHDKAIETATDATAGQPPGCCDCDDPGCCPPGCCGQ